MKYIATKDEKLAEVRIELSGNCYTDSTPLLPRMVFRKAPVDVSSQSLALAAAILTRTYCGEQFEFVGAKIGNDYAEAIRSVIGRDVNIGNVDGFHRKLSTAELDIIADEATSYRKSPPKLSNLDSLPLTVVTWSGDFVDVTTKSSQEFTFGTYFTNAPLFASKELVNIAIGLIHGRDKCRRLFVRDSEEGPRFEVLAQIKEALRMVSIDLVLC